jgi:hypothetical protein
MYYEIHVQIDFLDLLQEVNPDSDDYEMIEIRLRGLKYVESAWIDHSCGVKARLETDNWRVAEKRIKDLLGKTERLIRRYRPRC